MALREVRNITRRVAIDAGVVTAAVRVNSQFWGAWAEFWAPRIEIWYQH